ncbi:peptidoglycan DD-metalloendopeptidase family protein [Fulvimonas sp. R45]|uniref:peptidoglycan DD-metalloendopeptidase family protein n=1 Tax=Fulvimonas sp. R45 TaxID=3045937 RepID=UPI00265FA05F|nr:peptidoglycan DD-metalloendopeptidase family protein [Fulvimonas sp. R45]MDO1530432.1 peptidoglycan DD-metalloendopeptidase family protein [Fulvimonas sp. R45]
MIISPPFLPQGPASGDDAWLGQAMDVGGFGDGAFPLGKDFAWHGGVHLRAPRGPQGMLPVCAIADGTVAYVRTAKRPNNDPNDPQNYSGWTDNGCVIVKHTTEIGEGVTVVWFSIALHLSRIAPSVKQGQKVWRKDELGQAGSIDGEAGLIHFEIICDDANLAALVGRASGALPTGQDGRKTAVFGSVYLRLPAGTPFYDHVPASPAHPTPFTETTALPAPAWTSGDDLIVAMSLSRAGQAQAVTLRTDGQSVGTVPVPADAALFDQAVALAAAQQAVGRDAYELLRFGRVLDPVGDTANLPNWQLVAYPGGQGWVNLHAQGVHACSDADFPDWAGWRIVGDDPDTDSRCHSAALVDLILGDTGGASKDRQAKALGKVGGADMQTRLARTICQFTTEWEKGSIAARWSWLTKETPPGGGPMAGSYLKPQDFPKFQKHAEAMCFWEEANLGIPAKHWHFHPREFVRVFRQCGWLSADEMFQLFPMTAMRKAGHAWVSENVGVRKSLVANYHVELNKACRRYGIVTPLRMAAFYANAMQETMWFSTLHEDNSSTRYYPWDGRGFLQLTWPDNYVKYWRFVGKNVDDDLAKKLDAAQRKADKEGSNAPLMALEAAVAAASMKGWRDDVGEMTFVAADSAGAYWAWSYASQHADAEPANQRATKPATGAGSHTYYTSAGMGNVAATVNVGHPSTHYASVNGIVARFQAYNSCEVVLMDTPAFPGSNHPNEPQNYKPRRP